MKHELDPMLVARVLKEMAAEELQRKVRIAADRELALSVIASMGVKIGDRLTGNRGKPVTLTRVWAQSSRTGGDRIALSISYFGCALKADGSDSAREVELFDHFTAAGDELPKYVYLPQPAGT